MIYVNRLLTFFMRRWPGIRADLLHNLKGGGEGVSTNRGGEMFFCN